MRAGEGVRRRSGFPTGLVLALATALGIAACASTGGDPGATPHYQVGAPYQVNGRWYTPRVDPDYVASGSASWYGADFHGRRTANGEVFDRRRLSAAHKTLPLPSMVEVTNLENGRRVTLRVNDRGPFVDDRIIDLSEAAARELDFHRQGLARVRVRYLGPARIAEAAASPEGKARPGEGNRVRVAPGGGVNTVLASTPTRSPSPADDPIAAIIAGLSPLDDGRGDGRPSIWVRVADFPYPDAAISAQTALADVGPSRLVPAFSIGGAPVHTLLLGPYGDMATASTRLAAVRGAGYAEAAIDAAQHP